ncbi:50S ribosomal protein L18 [Candidatus Pacearchaeota archaeon]|nr:50S ribosomal protein L18P [uncultured archaeon]MBS3089421.1 50S ribosomal protein L18 [Candidatus Pacearchaeota archaeon]
MKRTIRRRRLEAKTDYTSRLALIKSGMPRLVVRRTNRYIVAQVIKTDLAQDSIVVGVISRDLINSGWPENKKGSLKSLPASYLTGYLLGKCAKEKKILEAVFDMGMHRNIKKSRIYAVLKGFVDAGVKVPHDKEILPDEEKLVGNQGNREIFTSVRKRLENGRERNKE